MNLNDEIKNKLYSMGADFVHFVDVSHLQKNQNQNYSNAILFGIALSPEFIQKVSETSDYLLMIKENNQIDSDEFYNKELKADQLADYIADYLKGKGFSSYSQSEAHIIATGLYNHKERSTPLPHKTIAGLAGIGWIGKHNLLVTPEYGSAICMCTVLTNAPFKNVLNYPMSSQCGNCNICKSICSVGAIEGIHWNKNISRDELVDVTKCNTCLKCLVHCIYTQKYVKKYTEGKK